MVSKKPLIRRRATQLTSMLRSRDYRDVSRRVARRAYKATGAEELEMPLLTTDICDSGTINWPRQANPATTREITVGWILMPPTAGSGGHTTIFRMIKALEDAGHRCVVYLYERSSTPASFHKAVIRAHWPQIKADVVDIADHTSSSCDAYFATSWETAHVLGSRGVAWPGQRFYLIQDYEPFFYPRGSEFALADDTYRFGFTHVAVGHMVADLVNKHAKAEVLEFSCDTTVYRLTNKSPRNGVVFYSRPQTPRRGHRLATLALSEFHRRHPGQTIHVFGDSRAELPFPTVNHSRMSPADLATLYNNSLMGIGFSFTNISLIVEEMLACGVIPIVNDDPYARADMPSTQVKWALPTPTAVVDAMSEIVNAPDRDSLAIVAAQSIRSDNWDTAGSRLVWVVEEKLGFSR